MKNKKKIYVVGLIFMLTACTPNEVSVGFEYETHLRGIMAGVKAKTQLYTLDSPIPVSLSFGHAIKSAPDNGDELRTLDQFVYISIIIIVMMISLLMFSIIAI